MEEKKLQFSDFALDEKILAALGDVEFEHPMPVQVATFEEALAGRDVLVQSQTGSGKTAAFLIPVFQKFVESEGTSKALILAPTRELAQQIFDEIAFLQGELSLRAVVLFGGVGYQKQEAALSEGVDIIVATPGRLLDYVKQNKLDLRQIDQLIIDEADNLFDMGFYPDVRDILKNARPREERQTMLFSATLSTKVRNLAWDLMNSPKEIEIESEHITVDAIDQSIYHVQNSEKFRLLLGLLQNFGAERGVIFCNTKIETELVAKRLTKNGFAARALMGDVPQKARLKIIKGMKDGSIPFLVATDVAARGLHIEDLPLVVNYDIPEDPENYVHRIGRTARAGKTGKAITLACERYVFFLEAVENYIEIKIPVEWPEEELFVEDKTEGEWIELEHTKSARDSRDGRDGRGRSGRGGRGSRDSRGDRDRGRGGRASDSRGGRGGRDGVRRGDARRDGSAPKRSQRRGNKSADELATMSTAERMAYYRDTYAGDLSVEQGSGARSGQGSRDKASGSERRRGRDKARDRARDTRGSRDGAHRGDARRDGSRATREDKRSSAGKPKKTDTRAPKASERKRAPKASNAQAQPQKKGLVSRIKKLFGGN